MITQRDIEYWERFDEAKDQIEAAAYAGIVEAAEEELEASQEAYEQEQDVLGRPWEELSETTIRQKGHDTILVESGNMKESGYVEEFPEEMKVHLGYSNWKVPFHEFGTEDIPARPFVTPMLIDLKHNRLLPIVDETLELELDDLDVQVTVHG